MRRATISVLLLLRLAAVGFAQASPRAPTDGPLAPDRLRADVEHLASPEMRGRGVGTKENEAVARWIAARFERLGLAPAVDGSWFHEFSMGGKPCRNVAGVLEAEGATEYIVIGAHHDHLGAIGDTVYHGADDNASGVAAVLALAAHFAADRKRLRRHMVFVSFDAEEKGMVGSRRFVQHGVIPTDKTAFMLVFDLIAGHFLPGEEKRYYAFGSEHSKAVRAILEERAKERSVETAILGTYLIEPLGPGISRSDYQAYRRNGVPYVFLTTGTPWYYHRPSDTPDKLDFGKMARILAVARDVLADVAMLAVKPDFIKKPRAELRDAHNLVRLLASILDRAAMLGLGERRKAAVETQLERIREIVERGKVDGRGKRVLQRAIVDVLRVAASCRPR